MPRSKQISVFLENKPGELARILLLLASKRINVLGVCAVDIPGKPEVKLLVADPEGALAVLATKGIHGYVEEVVSLELQDEPGTIAQIAERLTSAKVNVRNIYFTKSETTGGARVILVVSDVDAALAMLG